MMSRTSPSLLSSSCTYCSTQATLRRWELLVSSSSRATAMRSLPDSSRVSSIALTLSTLRLLCVVS
ncbi:gp6.6 protein [Escherichia phage K1F]|uniref:Gp6.6 protein n=1 Tax=Escherichia phage K1F TaxID=344021 RepID=Q2WC66_BPK1F|nr:gp6.6 protein [Escherichia phage K1F]CAJ29377.1 gp6.6 protein [Escherichia phage K1F]